MSNLTGRELNVLACAVSLHRAHLQADNETPADKLTEELGALDSGFEKILDFYRGEH